ncbi:hypothetical protein [Desulfobaculum bizertense]|uniref:Uncharacterized protein n=1 Tax=Desulfobaculum bizertense DSM 18034 TaxID=1121442 RepID=A0A1T4W0X5_9BACT|nr:hypothetical protein [Desulfobaculum bizertense]SKA70883.1 hypothetical protein SAMN02745702_01358 [Desulfobaculum bizertense DSM 18034]
MTQLFYKDQVLDTLAQRVNVAQFLSFSPNLEPRYSRIFGFAANHHFPSIKDNILALLKASPENSLNIRSFAPDSPQGNEFIYGLTDINEILLNLNRLAQKGLYTIVNETIDVNDGGVSGVLQNSRVEFAPGVIPRFVENPSVDPVPTYPKEIAERLLQTVYGFLPSLNYPPSERVEFSIHPKRRGWKNEHTIIWEIQSTKKDNISYSVTWPNAFSRLIGDKAYGLLIASTLHDFVPRTTCFSRNPKLGLFTFGTPTGSEQLWIRTCPAVQDPGKFTTQRGWTDPFNLMNNDDPTGQAIPSCLAQEEVTAVYSGALVNTTSGAPLIEGVRGFGDNFMLGTQSPSKIPTAIKKNVLSVFSKLSSKITVSRFEWVYDGNRVWIVQLHTGAPVSSDKIIYPGTPSTFISFDVHDGLEKLRKVVLQAQKTQQGINLQGNVGMSSHMADILRKAQIPSKIIPQ